MEARSAVRVKALTARDLNKVEGTLNTAQRMPGPNPDNMCVRVKGPGVVEPREGLSLRHVIVLASYCLLR